MSLRLQSTGFQIVLQQLRTYLGRVGWIAAEGMRHFRIATVGVVILDIIGVVSGAAMLGGIVLLVKNAETTEPLVVWGISIPSVQDVSRMLAFAGALAALGLLSAVSAYATKWLIGVIVVEYHRLCVRRVLEVLADPGFHGWQTLVEGQPYKAVIQLTGGDCRIMSGALRHLLGSVLPVATFCAAATALFVLDPLITLLLVPLAGLYATPFYRINRDVARQQRDFFAVNRAARNGVRTAIRSTIGKGCANASAPDVQSCLESQDWKQSEDLFCRRKLADDRMHLLNAVFFVVCLLGLFGLFAMQMRDGRGSWAALLLYVVSLRFVVATMRQVTSVGVILSRSLPQVDRYCRFIDGAERVRTRRLKSGRAAAMPARVTIKAPTGPMWGSTERLTVGPGQVVWVVMPWKPMRGDLEAAAAAIELQIRPPVDLFACARFVMPSMTGQESAWMAPASQQVSAVGREAELRQLADPAGGREARWITHVAGPADTAVIDAPAIAAGSARTSEGNGDVEAAAGNGWSDARAIFLAARVLARNDRNGSEPFTPPAESFVFVVTGPSVEEERFASQGFAAGTAGAVIIRGNRVAACGDAAWLTRSWGSIRTFLGADAGANAPDESDEDELELEN